MTPTLKEPAKLNQLLAKTDISATQYKALLSGYKSAFQHNQGLFKGLKKTYQPKEGQPMDPNYSANEKVQSTVKEYIEYFVNRAAPHLNNLLAVEATNAFGNAKAELLIEGVSFGFMSALELLRLKSVIVSSELSAIYESLPVRSDRINWTETSDPEYKGREVFEAPEVAGVSRTSEVTNYIIPDPNISVVVERLKTLQGYQPLIGQKRETIELGDYTKQDFSGEITHLQRAMILDRKTKLLMAIQEALVKCNEVPVVKSDCRAEAIFDYLHYGLLSNAA